jgi:hypothetical protein
MTNHVQTLKNKLGKIQAMVHTLNTGSNSRSVAMTRGEIMNIYNSMNDNFARAGHTAEAATIMNKAQRLIHG